MMKKHIILLALLLFAVSQGTFAQLTIFGSVVDAKDGSGIPGASVIVKGTIIGGITNSSGNFGLMNVPKDAILQVSFVGYKTVEVPVENQTRFNITLEPDVQILNEVVVEAERSQRQRTIVTPMGIERDIKTLPYAANHFFGDELRTGDITDLGRALNGRVPGLSLIQDEQGAGASTTIIFRNVGMPLYVIDGIPLPKETDGKTDISWLNLETVESVVILRGFSPGSIYGVAASAVIVITTKK